jgi:hypothetical protein
LLYLYALLQDALDKRVEILYREFGFPEKEPGIRYLKSDLFEHIGFLQRKGIDARSVFWHALVDFQSTIVHAPPRDYGSELKLFEQMFDHITHSPPFRTMKRPPIFQDEYGQRLNSEKAIKLILREVQTILRLLCYPMDWSG